VHVYSRIHFLASVAQVEAALLAAPPQTAMTCFAYPVRPLPLSISHLAAHHLQSRAQGHLRPQHRPSRATRLHPFASIPTPPPPNRRPAASRVAASGLRLLILALVDRATDLTVDVDASSNLALLSGRLRGVTVSASTLVFGGAPISGGVALYTQAVEVDLVRGLTGPTGEAFAVSVSATVTSEDLNARTGPMFGILQDLLRGIIATGTGGAMTRFLPEGVGTVETDLVGVLLEDAPVPVAASVLADLPFPNWFGVGKDINRAAQAAKAAAAAAAEARGSGRIVLQACTRLADGSAWRYDVRGGLIATEAGGVLELDSPEVVWRGVSFPLATVSRAGFTVANNCRVTTVRVSADRLFAEGVYVIQPPEDRRRFARPQATRTETRKLRDSTMRRIDE
jgi:hypothetical protein